MIVAASATVLAGSWPGSRGAMRASAVVSYMQTITAGHKVKAGLFTK
jgi:hypothetical protein